MTTLVGLKEPETMLDAYRYGQQVRPGCQHQLGCRCVAPYWCRESSPAELVREAKIRGGARVEEACSA